MAECTDKNCYVHGALRVRGARVTGRVVSDKGKRTVIVEREASKRISKYKRYARGSSRIPAHNPDCIGAKKGDMVRLGETRKVSRTKSWTVLEVMKGEKA